MSSGGTPSIAAPSTGSGTPGTKTVSSGSGGATTVTRKLIDTRLSHPTCHLSLSRETTQDKLQVTSGTPLNKKYLQTPLH